jgi:hypothetical protein
VAGIMEAHQGMSALAVLSVQFNVDMEEMSELLLTSVIRLSSSALYSYTPPSCRSSSQDADGGGGGGSSYGGGCDPGTYVTYAGAKRTI